MDQFITGKITGKVAEMSQQGNVTFYNGKQEEVIRLEPNGDTYIHGKLTENDKQIVDGMRELLAGKIDKTKLDQLKEMVKIQGNNGNWNYDPYMHGMFNGMELALATMENRDPVYKSAPDKWLVDFTEDKE